VKYSSCQIAIIGTGIVGIATAYYLAKNRGLTDIVLIDRNQPMTFTSAQSGENYRNWWPHPVMVAFTNRSIDLLEDCCDAFGATMNGHNVGTLADVATLSFYPAHHITMGEGGAVMMNRFALAKICKSYRDWGRDCYCEPGRDNTCGNRFGWSLGDLPKGYDHKYTYSHVGYNLKVSDMQAAVGLSQLKNRPFHRPPP